MNTTLTLSILSATIGLASCASPTPQRPEDAPYRSGTIQFGPTGAVLTASLAEPTVIDGVPCEGWVRFHESGSLKSADLSRDFSLAGHTLPGGTRIFLRADGTLECCWLSRDLEIDGIGCEGDRPKVATSFHHNGKLSSAFLSADQLIEGVPCNANLFNPVTFDQEGRLTGCELAWGWQQGGRTFPRGTVIRLGPAGAVAMMR